MLKTQEYLVEELIQTGEDLRGLVELINHKNKINKEEIESNDNCYLDDEWTLGLVKAPT